MEYRKTKALDAALYGLVEFKHEFGADLSPACLGELYAASALSLNLVAKKSNPGFDLIGDDGQRYQVKERAASTLNVNVNNFDFDWLILINLAADYTLAGLWKLDVDSAKALFRFRKTFRKYQATQKAVKQRAEKVV